MLKNSINSSNSINFIVHRWDSIEREQRYIIIYYILKFIIMDSLNKIIFFTEFW